MPHSNRPGRVGARTGAGWIGQVVERLPSTVSGPTRQQARAWLLRRLERPRKGGDVLDAGEVTP